MFLVRGGFFFKESYWVGGAGFPSGCYSPAPLFLPISNFFIVLPPPHVSFIALDLEGLPKVFYSPARDFYNYTELAFLPAAFDSSPVPSSFSYREKVERKIVLNLLPRDDQHTRGEFRSLAFVGWPSVMSLSPQINLLLSTL